MARVKLQSASSDFPFFVLSSYLAYILILTRPNEAGWPDDGSNVQPSSIKVTQQTIEQYEVLEKTASLKKTAASEKALASSLRRKSILKTPEGPGGGFETCIGEEGSRDSNMSF